MAPTMSNKATQVMVFLLAMSVVMNLYIVEAGFIDYGALRPDDLISRKKGNTPANPYTRGCEKTERCRGDDTNHLKELKRILARANMIRTIRGWRKGASDFGLLQQNPIRSRWVSSSSVIDMADRDGELRVFLVAGEVSGDNIGSRLMASLTQLSPFPVRFAGVGGSMMSKQGLKSLFPMEDIAVMGIWELLPHLNNFRVKLEETTEAALSFKPHVVVTVDAKGFSFRLLKKIRARTRSSPEGFLNPPRHFHYVAPSFWAWKGGESRLRGLSEFVDHVLCILPFEEEVCRLNGLAATFVGHPVLEDALEITMKGNPEEFRNQYGLFTEKGATIVSLLPGSRLQEVTRMLPIFLNTMELLRESCPSDQLTAAIHVAPNKHVEDYIANNSHKFNSEFILIPGGSINMRYDAFSASRIALCTSGTVAMELHLARVPCVVAYRAHLLTEWLIRYKAKVQYISLPNILLDEAVLPEVLFHRCTPSNLASFVREVMYNEGIRSVQAIASEKVLRLLLPPGGNEKLASLSNDYKPSTIAAFTILYSLP